MSDELFRRLFGDSEPTHLGSGWASGVGSVFLGALGLGAVLCLHFPSLLTFPELRARYPMSYIRALIQAVIAAALVLGVLSSILRQRKVLGLTGAALAITATLLGGASVPVEGPVRRGPAIGFDWFLLDLFATALVFVPIERIWPRLPEQGTFRPDWTTDGAYFFSTHAPVQLLSLLILLPATMAARWLAVPRLAETVGHWPFAVQFVLAILAADLAQYAVHRAFHAVPALWRFHAIHHSSRSLDWLAGSRFHFVELVGTRALVLIPVTLAGFSQAALTAYLGFVAFHATFTHANFGPRAAWLERLFVMPRFHHWHHAAHPEAIDRNFAIHFPWIDRLFGTFHLPAGAWPQRYGLVDGAVRQGFFAQQVAPFGRD